jgi:hypothetical protein
LGRAGGTLSALAQVLRNAAARRGVEAAGGAATGGSSLDEQLESLAVGRARRVPVAARSAAGVLEGGVAAQPGIYFASLDLAITRKSGTLFALTKEPQLLVEHVLARR